MRSPWTSTSTTSALSVPRSDLESTLIVGVRVHRIALRDDHALEGKVKQGAQRRQDPLAHLREENPKADEDSFDVELWFQAPQR